MSELTDKMVEILLPDEDAFLKVRETLTRIGIASRKEKKLFQSCHILHKRGHYYLVHFKELFGLDGKRSDFSDEDKARRNKIIQLLVEWDLIKVIDPNKIKEPVAQLSQIKILPFREKEEWTLVPKYSLGSNKFQRN